MAETSDAQLAEETVPVIDKKCEEAMEVAPKSSEDTSGPCSTIVNQPSMKAVTAKYEWYQTEGSIIIAVLQKNTTQEAVEVNLTENSVYCSFQKPNKSSLSLELAHPIVPMQSSWKILSSKVEIKLRKAEAIRWLNLERDQETESETLNLSKCNVGSNLTTYPSSCVHKKDWDKLVVDIKKEEEEEKPTGEAALNVLFQKIYTEGSDDVRRAMNKSFVESGGTVLSTNWKEVGANRVEVKPPDGLEWRQWNQ